MKPFVLLVSAVILLAAHNLSAQRLNWNNAPKTGFVFQITNSEAQKLLTKSAPDSIMASFLHTQVDTFNVNSEWKNRPDRGHFILARGIDNKLHCEYTSVFPYQVLLMKEYTALSLQVLDHEGNVRKDAKVKFRTRRIAFDRQSSTYRIEHEWFRASNKFVTVELDGFRSVFNIEKHEVPSWSNGYYNYDDGPDFYSYIITDKNKYKPGEKVRYKSYALSGSRYPIRRELQVWLRKPKGSVQLGTITPHRPGSFAGEFQLHDSLKLALDQFYTLQLTDKNGRIVSNCMFKYEDYELNGSKLNIELETPRQFFPAANQIKIAAASENGLMLKDARATITVLTENIRETFAPVVILSDTLMVKDVRLDPDTPTLVEIPSSIFGKANVAYNVHVTVLNSQNQRMERSIAGSHYFSQYEITAAFSNDSIVYQLLNNGKPMVHAPVKVFRDSAITGVEMTLPYREKINPATKTIAFRSDIASKTIRMSDMLPRIKIQGGIEKDSFNISMVNPQKIQVSWYVYQGSVLIMKGSGDEMEFKSKIEDRENTYYVELVYSFGGSDHLISREFVFQASSLDISLNLPDRVFPGQKVDALVEVRDEEGNPVSGVDLTAFATTAKLNYYVPSLPYYGQTSAERARKASYTKHDVNKKSVILNLDYQRWSRMLRLDTMKYYQFIYPGSKTFMHSVDIADGTQFAPYVMQDGAAKTIYVIEVDRQPVYYSWTRNPKAYSFYVQPEKMHQVTLRLYDRVLIFDSICFDSGKKTIFSFDLDHLPKGIKVHKIDPIMVSTGWFTKYEKWVFTAVEIRRHREYVAAFDETETHSFLSGQDLFTPLSPGTMAGNKIVAGPIMPGAQTYTQRNVVKTHYRHAGGFSYSFEDNIVYKTDAPDLIPKRLFDESHSPLPFINELAITEVAFLTQQSYASAKWHPRIADFIDNSCRVKLLLPEEKAKSGVASVLFQNCKTGEIQTPCRRNRGDSDYYTIPRGCFHVIVLYNNRSYRIVNGVELKSFSNIVADMTGESLHPADANSDRWIASIGNSCFSTAPPAAPRTIQLTSSRVNIGNVQGTIFDESNSTMPGVNIVVKGTTIGTASDAYGIFMLDIPEDPSTLVVSFIGYKTKEVEVRAGSDVSVVMEPDVQMLQELVVVGYGTQKRSEMTGAVSSLSGRAAGVSISARTDDENEEVADVTQSEEAEQKLYEELLTLKNIRSQFSDVAFWEPRLFSDRHGKSKFTVTFPDDITRWDAVVYGMNRRLQTGTVRKSIKSYKPLMAELHVPTFLTVGDSAEFIGKILNYTNTKMISGKSKWTEAHSSERDVTFDSYHTETFPVVATSNDSITTAYSFTRDDGYFDGEERKVPVVDQGTVRASGTLTMLKKDDEVHIHAAKNAVVNVEIIANPLDVWARDVAYLIHYRYDCNEQLASKLIGLLNHKLLMQYEEKPFKYDADVKRIVQRLLKNQNEEFLWSWWDVSPGTSYWMSAHILRALKAAKDAGYIVNLDVANLTRKATYKMQFLGDLSIADVQLIHALAMWDASLDYDKYIRALEEKVRESDALAAQRRNRYQVEYYSTLNEKLLLMEVRQMKGLAFNRESLLQYKKTTILNEVYFDDDQPAPYWYYSEMVSNTIAYRIVRRDSTLSQLTTSMQMYFLSLRRAGQWNTYETANVLMTILPDLIAQGSSKKNPATISIAGNINARIQKFPHKVQLRDGADITLRQESGLPLYCMQYVQERVATAHAGTDGFTIKTAFSENVLKAGEPMVLTATVEVKRDAKLNHVMIEIPIPGGCSYADKRQFDNRVETHREYFKEKTVIFCENMTSGTYVFQVQLLPRFTGKFHVNPAQVSLMYFPVINVNNDMKKVKVE